jgi:hypothetical protein
MNMPHIGVLQLNSSECAVGCAESSNWISSEWHLLFDAQKNSSKRESRLF